MSAPASWIVPESSQYDFDEVSGPAQAYAVVDPKQETVEQFKEAHPFTYAEEQGGTNTVDGDEHIINGKVVGHRIAGDMFISPKMKIEYDRLGLDAFLEAGTKMFKAEWRWPNGVVHYKFSPGYHFEAATLTAMRTIEAITCIKFREATADTKDYIIYQEKNDGCWSYVGFQHTSHQPVNIGGQGCAGIGTIMHELGHALGLEHEQSRADRDKFVRINWQNIKKGEAAQFEKANNYGKVEVRYDYNSLMHYGPYAFTSNKKPTIVAVEEGHPIGERAMWAAGDIQQLNEMYECSTKVYGPVWKQKREWEKLREKMESKGCVDKEVEHCPSYAKDFECDAELESGPSPVSVLCPMTCKASPCTGRMLNEDRRMKNKYKVAIKAHATGAQLRATKNAVVSHEMNEAKAVAKAVKGEEYNVKEEEAAGCKDAEETGLLNDDNTDATCAHLKHACTDDPDSKEIQKKCPVTCETCPLPHCEDVKDTGWLNDDNTDATCAQLKDSCTDDPDSKEIQRKCPVTCGTCP